MKVLIMSSSKQFSTKRKIGINEMLVLVKIQYQEMEKAVVRTGEYRFRGKFAYLEKPLSVWTGMSVEQRKRHMKKVNTAVIAGVPVVHSDDEHPVGLEPDDGESDSHGIGLLPAPLNLSPIVWDRMVAKPKTIVSDPASMSPIPGSNNKSRFVVSFRNPNSPMKI